MADLTDETIVLLCIFGGLLFIILVYLLIRYDLYPRFFLSRYKPEYNKKYVRSVSQNSKDQNFSQASQASIGSFTYKSQGSADERVTVEQNSFPNVRTNPFRSLFKK